MSALLSILPTETHDPSLFPNKYVYDEFAGYQGERLLKSILHQIMPIALYRVWEILVDEQAPGNDCFLSIASISKTTQRVERTIRLHLREMEACKLLTQRPEQKLLLQKDGSPRWRSVVVKDFTGLYTLALEYLQWTQSNSYIEPERDVVDLILSNDTLKRKLIRFDNYRRLMTNTVSGPKPQEREKHRRYAEYDPEQEQETPTNALQSEDSTSNTGAIAEKGAKWKKQTPKQVSKEISKASLERKRTKDYREYLSGDSFDSEFHSEEGAGGGYTKSQDVTHNEARERRETHTTTTNTTKTNPVPPASEAMPAKQASVKRQADLDGQAQVMAAIQATQGSLRGPHAVPKAPSPNRLVTAFVREASLPFHDQNVKASLTHALRIVDQTSLTQKEILACLVKAYIVAQEAKTVKPQHRHPEGDNRMPLFCSMFDRFVTQCSSGNFGYTDEHLTRDIATDDRLVMFVTGHRPEDAVVEARDGQESPAQEESSSIGQDTSTDLSALPEESAVEARDGQDAPAQEESSSIGQDASTDLSAPQQPPVIGEAHAEEPFGGEQPPRVLHAESPELGWRTDESAYWWADQLLNRLDRNAYSTEVYPTRHGRYGFKLFLRVNPSESWVFLTTKEVKQCLGNRGRG